MRKREGEVQERFAPTNYGVIDAPKMSLHVHVMPTLVCCMFRYVSYKQFDTLTVENGVQNFKTIYYCSALKGKGLLSTTTLLVRTPFHSHAISTAASVRALVHVNSAHHHSPIGPSHGGPGSCTAFDGPVAPVAPLAPAAPLSPAVIQQFVMTDTLLSISGPDFFFWGGGMGTVPRRSR